MQNKKKAFFQRGFCLQDVGLFFALFFALSIAITGAVQAQQVGASEAAVATAQPEEAGQDSVSAAEDEFDVLLRQAAEDDAKTGAVALPDPAALPAVRQKPELAVTPVVAASKEMASASSSAAKLRGFAQFELARAVNDPDHWSKMLTRVELGRSGKINDWLKWKVSARVDYDGVFDADNFYSDEVRRDQRFNMGFRETYLDMDAGNWDIRLGRQHVVWGEMVGLFFADVVSARDMREFILPEFNILRIPQWAARAEYFKDDFHAELLWIPVPTYDETGKPGSEFFPFQPEYAGFATKYRVEDKPDRKLANSNFGVRGSWLVKGWDISGFFYRSMDAAPTFYRQVVLGPQPEVIYQARHDRISQVGGTLAKDFGSMVLKSEMVATRGRRLGVLRLSDDDGVVRQNIFDWVVGLDIPLPSEARFNAQIFQSIITNHDRDVIPDEVESGYSLLLNGKLASQVEAEVLWVASFNRTDWMLRPKVNWTFEKNWRLSTGVDVFHGPAEGLFGRYNNRDRVFTEIKHFF
ncbi:MAG TPA: hypothetical protein PK372_07030 [Rugosibacter sp.]|nr:hypothetical protein [Rugosibacter sp.]